MSCTPFVISWELRLVLHVVCGQDSVSHSPEHSLNARKVYTGLLSSTPTLAAHVGRDGA